MPKTKTKTTKYKVQTPGKYLVKGTNQLTIGEGFYSIKDLKGYSSKVHMVQLKGTDGSLHVFFPGQAIEIKKEPKEPKSQD